MEMVRDAPDLTCEQRITDKRVFFNAKLQTRDVHAFVSQKKKGLLWYIHTQESMGKNAHQNTHKETEYRGKRVRKTDRALCKSSELCCCVVQQ